MADETRYANTEVRPYFRNASIRNWGPFVWGSLEIKGKHLYTRQRQVGICLFNYSVVISFSRADE
jgi:hypothetical protein